MPPADTSLPGLGHKFASSILGRERFRVLTRVTAWLQTGLEVGLIAIWAVWVGRNYLNFDPQVVPAGREFSSAIQAQHLWTRFQTCGLCALWDGSERGGFPAFVDPLASSLHPLVAVATLLFGVVNAAKISLIVSLGIAGFAQWWLGRVLKLGFLARLWGALMVMVGGQLAGRMELGIFSVVLSTAMVSLTFAPSIRLAETGERRTAIILAVILALLAVSGQGYMQAGLLFMSPAYLILILGLGPRTRLVERRFLLAAGLALLLAAPFLVPFAHFWPNFVKDTDPNFGAGQPLAYYLLNLFIDDREFLYSTLLGKLPYPHLYTMFIGWIPVGLALLCLRLARREDYRNLFFLAACAGLAIFVGSTLPLKWLQPKIHWLQLFRYAPMIGGLAVPPIVGLASYALDRLLKMKWPNISLGLGFEQPLTNKQFSLRWLVLVPLFLALQSGYKFSQLWIYTVKTDDGITKLLNGLKTSDLQWVEPPFGVHAYIEPAVAMGLKLSPGIMTWRWRGRDFPVPVLEANNAGPPPNTIKQIDEIENIPIYATQGSPYASVISDSGLEPCKATGLGGDLQVVCENNSPGRLVVEENTWSGWKAWMDGKRTQLLGDRWLEVDAPAGEHTYRFRYLPWDVPLGFILLIGGILLCVRLWFYADTPRD